jgi:hypothetical protein
MLGRLILSWILFCTLAPARVDGASDRIECDFEPAPTVTFADGAEFVRMLPEEASAELVSQGRYYAPSEMLPARFCPGLVQALVIFDAPPSRVLELLSQTQHQSEYLHHADVMRPVLRSEEESIVHYELKILFTRLRYRIHYRVQPGESRIWWQLDSEYDNDLESARGYWELHPLAAADPGSSVAAGGDVELRESERTLALYGTRVDVGAALPQRMQDALTRKKMKQSIRETRDWINAQEAAQP